MKISIDFDDTYTRDPQLWDQFIRMALSKGHEVYCVTMRSYDEGHDVRISIGRQVGEENIHYTNRMAKKPFMQERNINIDVWIDDSPRWILGNAQ
jgi:hypothetical protein